MTSTQEIKVPDIGDFESVDVIEVRRRVGMVFQKSNPFPKSIYENVVYGLRIAGMSNRSDLDDAVEKALRNAALWDEVGDRLHTSAFGLSGGQQQQLAIARALITRPKLLLLDEPLANLDHSASQQCLAYLQRLARELDLPMLYVSHDIEEVSQLADHLREEISRGRWVGHRQRAHRSCAPTRCVRRLAAQRACSAIMKTS